MPANVLQPRRSTLVSDSLDTRRRAGSRGGGNFPRQLKQAVPLPHFDGRGRVFDNIFIERLWRTVKYEHLYLHDDQTVAAVTNGVDQYVQFHNTKRPHQSLGYRPQPWCMMHKDRFT